MASEEYLDKKLKDPDESDNASIRRLIDKTIHDAHKVYLATDWHLWLRDEKDKPQCHQRSDFKSVLSSVNETCTPNDLLIYLGDLVDGEFQEKDLLKQALLTLHMPRIMVRGNNDLFDKAFYKSCGFSYVVDAFTWGDIIFTHIPIKNDKTINVHGHIHGYRTYWLPYTNQIDVAAYGGRKTPVEMMYLIKQQPKYAKTIKECPEHFNEQFNGDVFESVMNDIFEHDPFPDQSIFEQYQWLDYSYDDLTDMGGVCKIR